MCQTPVLFICPVTRPRLPNTAQIPLENCPLPPLTPRGLSETHTLAQLHGVAQEGPGRLCHPTRLRAVVAHGWKLRTFE